MSEEERIAAFRTLVTSKLPFPTFSDHLQGLNLLTCDPNTGRVEFEYTVPSSVCDESGKVYDGFIGLAIDEIPTWGLMLYDVEGRPGVSANIDISFCQPIKVGTKIILEGVCSKAGRTLAFLQCRIFNETKEILYSSGTHVKFVQQVPIVNKVSSSAPVHIPKKVVTNFTNVSHPLTEEEKRMEKEINNYLNKQSTQEENIRKAFNNLKATRVDLQKKEVFYEIEVDQSHINIASNMHGGCTLSLSDEILRTTQLLVENEINSETTSLSMMYCAPVPVGITLGAIGKVISTTRDKIFLEGTLFNKKNGSVVAISLLSAVRNPNAPLRSNL